MSALEALEALNTLNSCSQKYTNFDNLKVGEYPVRRFTIVETKQGDRVRADLDEYFVFLPKRYFDKISEERCAVLNKFKYIMVYSGKEYGNKDRIILTFKLAPPAADSLPLIDVDYSF